MSYIVEYTTLSGKRIPILHKIFESAESAEAFGEQGVSSGNYRDYAVVEQDDKETLEKIAYHKRMNARHVAFANQAHEAGNTELRDQHKEAAKQHRRAQLDYEDGSPRAAQRSMDANIMSGLIIEAAPKMQGDWLKAQREKDRAHADAMGRHVKSGRKKSYTSTQRSLAQLRGEELPEGYKELPKMDTERYGERAGLEGPFQTMAGKVVYYDPKEGAYYDPDTDMYMSYDEFKALDNDRTGMREAEGDGNYARIIYDYSDNWGSIDIYKNHEKVDAWDDYFGANETGNPLAAKFVEMAKANGLDPMTLEVVDENGDIGKFDGKKFTWNMKEAAAKIACVKCDEVSTAAAWKKNNGFCPKCKTSSQGVAESINEDISAEAHHMERDHEVQMARSDLYKTANYAIKLHSILKGISEEQGLEGWMQAKITKAADYLSSVFHALEYDELERSQSEPMPATESVEEGMTASQHRQKMIDKIKKSGSVKSGSMSKDEEKVEETTTAGAIATAPMPMGKIIKRKKK